MLLNIVILISAFIHNLAPSVTHSSFMFLGCEGCYFMYNLTLEYGGGQLKSNRYADLII